mmetsp:Transcript_14398/g.25896  ORF Transcript_14398/g.25896 Transcript_14398/m.25896 type:complete len:488 (+) Transcript_14398:123-1586(+)
MRANGPRGFSAHIAARNGSRSSTSPANCTPTTNAKKETASERYKEFEALYREKPDMANFSISLPDTHPPPHKEKAAMYSNCVLLKFVPPEVTEAMLKKAVENHAGFVSLHIFRPDQKSRDLSRTGWIKFSGQDEAKHALKSLASTTVGKYSLRVFAAVRPAPLMVPKETLDDENVKKDLKLAMDLCRKLDQEFEVEDSFFFAEDILHPKLPEIKRLNMVIEYLRHVHLYSYYTAQAFVSKEHMIKNTGESFERRQKVEDPDKWYSALHAEIKKTIEKAIASPEEEKEGDEKYANMCISFLESKTLALNEPNKFRCALCSKLFRGSEFVHKHIKNKHKPAVDKAIVQVQEESFLENYLADRHKILGLPFFPATSRLPRSTGPRGPPHSAPRHDRRRGDYYRDRDNRDSYRSRDSYRERRRSPPRERDRDRDRERSPPPRRRSGGGYRNGSPPPRRDSNLVTYDDIDAPAEEEIVVDYGFGMDLDELED